MTHDPKLDTKISAPITLSEQDLLEREKKRAEWRSLAEPITRRDMLRILDALNMAVDCQSLIDNLKREWEIEG